jgi:hypothetical protein
MRLAATSSFVILLAASTPAFAQDELARRQAVELAATRVPLEKATTGAPYSAETIVENVQTLADGNRIVRKTTGRVYRDGEGRTRREEEGQVMTARTPNGPVTANRRTTISIADPVGGFSYSLDPERKIAWRTPIGASAAIMEKIDAAKVEQMKAELQMRAARAAGAGDKPSTDARAAEEQKVLEAQKRAAAGGGGRGVGVGGGAGGEVRMRGSSTGYAFGPDNAGPLERKTLDGIPVEGRKTTTVIPAGQVGNEQPLSIVSEEWRSPDLKVLVFTRYSDPRTGESTYRLTNIIRAEPDRSLFMVPPDYEVRETGVRKMLESKQ